MSAKQEFPSTAYSKAQEKWLGRDHLITPTIRKALNSDGGVDGKSIIDIGCGNGHYSRDFLTWGAKKVVGVDNSSEMIQQCRAASSEQSRHLEFQLADISDVSNFGKGDSDFDIATAFFVLQFIYDKEKLKVAIKNIWKKLRKGGMIYALVPNGVDGVNPPADVGQKLGASIERDWSDPFVDGEILQINFYQDQKICSNAKIARHSQKFYEQSLKEAGFDDITWITPHFSPYAVSVLGEQFCLQFTNPPCDIMFRARKC